MIVKVRIESYLYNGPHRYFHRNGARKWFDQSKLHYDWRYKITINGVVVRRSQAFCSWERACASAERNVPKLLADLALGCTSPVPEV